MFLQDNLCGLGCQGSQEPRFFLCNRCRRQVVICSRCDRGQVYCGRDCATEVRRSRQREARRRYQASERGRQLHADRSRRFRARGRRVTDQGPTLGTPDNQQPEPAHAAVAPGATSHLPRCRAPNCVPSLRASRRQSGPHGANSSAAQTRDHSLRRPTGTKTSAKKYGFTQALTARPTRSGNRRVPAKP